MALRVPGLVAVDIADYGRRYMISDRPSARLLGLASRQPDWLSRVQIRGITIGRDTRDASIIKRGRETVIEHVQAHGIEVLQGTAEAALGATRQKSQRRADRIPVRRRGRQPGFAAHG